MITLITDNVVNDIHRYTDIKRMGLTNKLVLVINQPAKIEHNLFYVGDCVMSMSFVQMFEEVYVNGKLVNK